MIRSKTTQLFESVEDVPPDYLNTGRLRIGDIIEDLDYNDNEVLLLETAGLTFDLWDAGKNKVGATVNGTKYEYVPKGNVTVADIWRIVKGMKKHSDGKALAWLKKNATSTRLRESQEATLVIEDPDKFIRQLKKSKLLSEKWEDSKKLVRDDPQAAMNQVMKQAVKNPDNDIQHSSDIERGKKIKIPYFTLGVLASNLKEWGLKQK